MTELDGELPETVKEIIDEFGVDVVYTIIGESDYDTETGENAPGETVVGGVKVTPPEAYSPIVVSNSNGLIERKDLKFVTSPLYFGNVTPTNGDTFLFNQTLVTVIDVNPVYSGELVCAFEIQGRT